MIQEKCMTLHLCAQRYQCKIKRDASRDAPLSYMHPPSILISPYSETHCHFTVLMKTFTKSSSCPNKTVRLSVCFPPWATVCMSIRARGRRKLKSTNGRELLSIESFGYICEDQSTGPLGGALGGCESLQRR